MAITPRSNEVSALVELLEDESFEDASALAKALYKRVWELIGEREVLWGARQEYAGLTLAYGPFSSATDATRAVQASGLAGEWGIGQLWPSGVLTKQDATDASLCDCGHPKGPHDHPKAHGRCLAGAKSMKTRPCSCPHFKQTS